MNMIEFFIGLWPVLGVLAFILMWMAQRDLVSAWLCFLGGPVGLGVALAEFYRS